MSKYLIFPEILFKDRRLLLAAWLTAAARGREIGGVRTLRVEEERVVYDVGVLGDAARAADLYLVDGEMRYAEPSDVSVTASRRWNCCVSRSNVDCASWYWLFLS